MAKYHKTGDQLINIIRLVTVVAISSTLLTMHSLIVAEKNNRFQSRPLITDIEWRPDGQMLSVAFRNGEVRLYMFDMTPVAQLPLDVGQTPWQLVWSPDGSLLAASTTSMGREDRIYIWNTDSLTLIQTIQQNQSDSAFVDWSPDNEHLAATDEEFINIWYVTSGELERALVGHVLPGTALGVAWHPDGAYIASVGSDRALRIWDTTTGNSVSVTNLPWRKALNIVTWSPDGNAIAVVANEVVYILSYPALQPIVDLPGDSIFTTQLEWKGNKLVTSGADNAIRVVNTDTWQLERVINLPQDASKAISLSDDGAYLAYNDGGSLPMVITVESSVTCTASTTSRQCHNQHT